MTARPKFTTAQERWELLALCALAVEHKPHSPTALDVMERHAFKAEQGQPMPYRALRGMALRWRQMDERGRDSNAKALGELARRVQAVLKGEADPGAPQMRPRADLE